ncbi:FabA/FabZ family ACP-dehydratase [uncultured Kriegella sp.]|uniref:3-hydroxyacyl-ACP dehydratase FabZ family protein n=1 Tax=uncultured Kriegella sp. TaxID=1798910 RepID=UPI0030DAA93C|tara:strand:+ start:123782 stop:124252 length:471 start_codon:yes stop_codon:yes gene_type:complete
MKANESNSKSRYDDIIQKLPYEKPFLFVDTLLHVDENGAEGCFTFSDTLSFYRGHFKNNPITPGVILTECCAQIGLVCLGIFLLDQRDQWKQSGLKMGLSSSEMEFFLPVLPNEKVRVCSEKVYFRFNKLKCLLRMYNESDELVCKGKISGMLTNV